MTQPTHKAAFYERTSRKQAQLDNTKQWITQAYIKLLDSTDEKDISISTICREAGVGRQTFYRHFNSAEGILLREMERLSKELKREMMDTGERPIKDYTVFLLIFRKWKNNRHLLPLIKSASFSGTYLNQFRELRAFLEKELDFPHIENDYIRQFRQGGINAVFFNWLNSDMKSPPEEMALLLIEHCL